MSLLEVLGLVATAITFAQVGIQVRQLVSAPSVAGVSVHSWVLASVQSTGLMLFALSKDYFAAIVVNAVIAVACVAVVFMLTLRRNDVWKSGLELALAQAVCLATSVGFGANAAGSLGAAAAGVVWVPQAIRAVRTRRSDGLSRWFVTAGVVSSALWLVYAILHGEWRLAVAPTSAIASMVVTAIGAFSAGSVRSGAASATSVKHVKTTTHSRSDRA